jgi:hypothetical protein
MSEKEKWTEEYLKKKKLYSYEEYLDALGTDSEKSYRESITRADTAYATAKASYSRRASSLLSRGLTASGYGDYLDGAAYAARSRAISDAQKEKTEAEERNKSAYAEYLAKAEEEASDAYDQMEKDTATAFSKLLSQKIVDEDAARDYLISLGVDEENATSLAEKNSEILHSTQARRNAVLNFALKNQMRYKRAYAYATANGLSEEVAREIAKISQAARDALFGNEETYVFDESRYQ